MRVGFFAIISASRLSICCCKSFKSRFWCFRLANSTRSRSKSILLMSNCLSLLSLLILTSIASLTIRGELYYAQQENHVSLPWNWALAAFGQEQVRVNSSLKAVVLLKKENGAIYAITFGHAFFLIDKFCDRDFGFGFARKMNFKGIKTITLTAPICP